MERFLPLLILLIISSVISSAGKKNKKASRSARQQPPRQDAALHAAGRQTAQPQPGAGQKQPAVSPAPAKQPEPTYFEQAQRSVHRGADGTLHPTERSGASAAPDPQAAIFEGDDPCHAYMLEDPGLPGCEEDKAPLRTDHAGLSLSFTKDQVVNAVIMSEILNRRAPRRRAG